jgi:hypothetical protein
VLLWGRFQVEADGGNPEDGLTLRAKILPALKRIRFGVVEPTNFAKLCQRDLGAVLSVGEKLLIFKALGAGNVDLLPADFCRSKKNRSPRNSGCIQLHFVKCNSEVTVRKGAEHSAQFTFHVNKRATLSAPYMIGGCWSILRQELRDEVGNVVIDPESFKDSNYILAADENYTLAITYFCDFHDDVDEERSCETFELPANTVVSKLDFTVTATSCTTFIGAHGLQMYFRAAFSYPL